MPVTGGAVNANGFVRSDARLRCRLGDTEAELATRALVDWLHPEDRENFLDVIAAGDGIEAIERFRATSESIDCVLLDPNRPKLDGEEVVRELKALYPEAQILLSSGYSERAMLGRFHRGEVLGVIEKPFNVSNLLENIGESTATPVGNSEPATGLQYTLRNRFPGP